MFAFSTRVTIACSKAHVYAILTDFEHYLAQWADGPVVAERLSPGLPGVGTRYRITAQIGPLRLKSPYELLTWQPPARFSGRGIAGPVHFEEEYELIDEGGGTTLTQTIRAWPRGLFGLLEPLLQRQMKRLIAADLQRLKALVERT